MLKKILGAVLASLMAGTAGAAVDINKATQAELEAIPGVGPTTSTLIVGERKKSEFKDWTDFVSRVQGVGDRSAARFSEGGLRVQGKPYGGAPYVAKVAQSPAGAKAASGSGRAVDAVKAAPAKAASAAKSGAPGVKGTERKAAPASTAASAAKK